MVWWLGLQFWFALTRFHSIEWLLFNYISCSINTEVNLDYRMRSRPCVSVTPRWRRIAYLKIRKFRTRINCVAEIWSCHWPTWAISKSTYTILTLDSTRDYFRISSWILETVNEILFTGIIKSNPFSRHCPEPTAKCARKLSHTTNWFMHTLQG